MHDVQINHSEFIVRYRDVVKSYEADAPVIQSLNLDVRRGEFLTMLGPSGSGKTTTLMMLAGFVSPDRGEIYFNDSPISGIAPWDRGIGMVFQDYALFPHMTVEENLAFPLQVRGVPRSQISIKIRQALDMVRMPQFSSRMPAQLSGGQKQRIALARALVFEPELVLMDEPLGALDKTLREEMQYEIKAIHRTLGVTMIYVTHDQSEAMTMSDRIAVFNEGRIEQLASPSDVYRAPTSCFVAGFVGESNMIVGQITESTDRTCTIALPGGSRISAVGEKRSHASTATVLVRPECLQVQTCQNALANQIRGRVLELIYLGDHVRAHVEVDGGQKFVAKMLNANLQSSPQVGATVYIGWRTEDCRVVGSM